MSNPGRHSPDRDESAASPTDAHSSSWTNGTGPALLPRVRTRGSPAQAAPGKSLSGNDHVSPLLSATASDSNASSLHPPAERADLPTRAHTMNDSLPSSSRAASVPSSSALPATTLSASTNHFPPDFALEPGKHGKPRPPIPGQMTPLTALLGSPGIAAVSLSGPDASPPPMLLPSPPVSPAGNCCAGKSAARAEGGVVRAGSWRLSDDGSGAAGTGGRGTGGSGVDSAHVVAAVSSEGAAEGGAGGAGEAGREAGGADADGGCFFESVRVPRDVVLVWQDCWRGAWQADVEIRSAVDGGLVLAQGAVLAAHSQGLERMLAGAMLQQARPPWVIVLKGVPVEAVRGVVQTLYCGTMDDGLMDRYVFHLLLLAYSLQIPLLKSLCLEALRARLLSPANAVDALVLARLVGSRALQALTQQYIVRHHAEVALTDGWAMLSQQYPDVKKMLEDAAAARNGRGTSLQGEEGWARQQVQEAVRALEHICSDGCCSSSSSSYASAAASAASSPPSAVSSAADGDGGRVGGSGGEGGGAEGGAGGEDGERGGSDAAAAGGESLQGQPVQAVQTGQTDQSGPLAPTLLSLSSFSQSVNGSGNLSTLSSSSSIPSVRPMSPTTPATPAAPPTPCGLPKCRAVEGLIRHFAKCGVKVSGGCGRCKVVWQLLEQHAARCGRQRGCRVPLCRQFKSKQQQEEEQGGVSARREATPAAAAESAHQVTALAKALSDLEGSQALSVVGA